MRHEFDHWVRKIPGSGNGNPYQYSSLKNSMDRGAWWATVQVSQRVRHDWARTHTYTLTCPCQGCGEKYYLLHQNQSRGKLFSFLLFFPQFPASLHVFSDYPPPPILPFFQSHSLLDFISLKKHIYLFVSMCTRQVWINNHNEAQNYTSVFFLPWTSAGQQKISRTEGAAGREKATPVPFSPHTVNPRLSWLQTLCITLFRQGSLDPLQTSCQLMFCSLMQMMLELLKCSSVSGQNINKLTVSSHPTSIIVPGGCITLYEPARLLWQMNITFTSINLSSLLIGVLWLQA